MHSWNNLKYKEYKEISGIGPKNPAASTTKNEQMNVQSPATASSNSSSSSTWWASLGGHEGQSQQHKGNLKEMKENLNSWTHQG